MSSKYAGFMPNDFINGEGVCVSLWTQGCPHHCPGCFNESTWDFNGGLEVPSDIRGQIIKGISANGITRNFSILGGEPLCEENKEFVWYILQAVRSAYPDIKIFLWSGYTYQELLDRNDEIINNILANINTLIDGKFEIDKRDLTLKLRGSSNQNIIDLN
jgi:anaerobic ribonucleoside-triphosphate reductase activating protein